MSVQGKKKETGKKTRNRYKQKDILLSGCLYNICHLRAAPMRKTPTVGQPAVDLTREAITACKSWNPY